MDLQADDSNFNGFEPKTETVEICPLCQNSETKFLFWNYDRLHRLPGKFGIVQCQNCQLVRLSPRPVRESLGFYYPEENYYSYQSPKNTISNISSRPLIGKIRDGIRNSVLHYLGYPVAEPKKWQKFLQPFFVKVFKKQATFGWNDRFPRYVENGRALDIGCGNGEFLNYLKTNGWQVNGVEINEKAAAVAKDNFDIEVFVGQLEDASFAPKSFDYIYFSHVLEHIPDPTAFLRNVHEILKDTGTIYIEVPNYDSISRKISSQFWFPWETPRHLFMFSPATLKKQVEAAGFKVIKIKTKLEDLYEIAENYQIEESLGKKLPEETTLSTKKLIKTKFFSSISRIGWLIRPQSGEFIGCWIKKDI